MSSLPPPRLQQWVSQLFTVMGVTGEVADAVAESLVDADLRGIGTHGVVRVPIYAKRIEVGVVNKTPQGKLIPLAPALARFDGDNGFGQWVGLRAIQRACEMAAETGIAMVLATQSNHFGTAGWFGRKAAEHGCAALVWSQCESLVVPFGGTKRIFGTNPLCMTMPREGADPLCLDMATSAVPLGKVEVAKVTSGTIPETWGVDADGAPTTDPHKVHALQPMAGPKGSGLALMIDVLTGGLAGRTCGYDIKRLYDNFDVPQGLVHTFIAIKAAAFGNGAEQSAVIEKLSADLHAQTSAPGFDEVLLPGEVESRNSTRNERDGIQLSSTLLESLNALASRYGIGELA